MEVPHISSTEEALRILHQKVVTLLTALTGERDKTLKELFAHLCGPVSRSVRGFLGVTEGIRYYEVLAEYYQEKPGAVLGLKTQCMALWSNKLFAPIWAALFYRWLLTHGSAKTKNLNLFLLGANRLFWFDIEHHTSFFKPLYLYIHHHFLHQEKLSEDPSFVLEQALKVTLLDFYELIAAFWFWYMKPGRCLDFLQAVERIVGQSWLRASSEKRPHILEVKTYAALTYCQVCGRILWGLREQGLACTLCGLAVHSHCRTTEPCAGWAALGLSSRVHVDMAAVSTFFNSVKFGDTFGDRTVLADIFVTAVLSQMKKIKSEAGLNFELNSTFDDLFLCPSFLQLIGQGVDLAPRTRLKMKSLVYKHTLPGSPLFPTQHVRSVARASMDDLFPAGKYTRRVVYLFFRLLHPYYAVQSLWHRLSLLLTVLTAWFFTLLHRGPRAKDRRTKPRAETELIVEELVDAMSASSG